MVSSHVAHDCQVGNHVILANGVALGGHVAIEDHGIVGGLAGVHQFVDAEVIATENPRIELTRDEVFPVLS